MPRTWTGACGAKNAMHLDVIAVVSVGMLIAARVFVSLVEGHYRAALDIRRAINRAIESAEAAKRQREAAKAKLQEAGM